MGDTLHVVLGFLISYNISKVNLAFFLKEAPGDFFYIFYQNVKMGFSFFNIFSPVDRIIDFPINPPPLPYLSFPRFRPTRPF